MARRHTEQGRRSIELSSRERGLVCPSDELDRSAEGHTPPCTEEPAAAGDGTRDEHDGGEDADELLDARRWRVVARWLLAHGGAGARAR